MTLRSVRPGTLTWGGAGWASAGSVQRWSRRRGWGGRGHSGGWAEAGEDVRVGVDRMVGSVAHGQHSVERVNTGGRGRHLPWLLSDHSLVSWLRRTWPTLVSGNSLKQTKMRRCNIVTLWHCDSVRVWECDIVTVWQCDSVGVWPWYLVPPMDHYQLSGELCLYRAVRPHLLLH